MASVYLLGTRSPRTGLLMHGTFRATAVSLTRTTSKATKLKPLHPNVGLRIAYQKKIDKLIDEMHASTVYWLKSTYRNNPPLMAQDAAIEWKILQKAKASDVFDFAVGLKRIKLVADTDRWHASTENGTVTLEHKFSELPRDEQIHILLHELGHVGQQIAPKLYAEFMYDHEAKLTSFIAIANKVHLKDFRRTKRVESGLGAEVFAESYARYCLGLSMPEDLKAFWESKRAFSSMAMDDVLPANALKRAIALLKKRWLRNFELAAPKLADYFSLAVHKRTDQALAAILRKGGFSVRFQMTKAMKDVLEATTAENVGLIKSIGNQYFAEIEGLVMRSVSAGGDLGTLAKALEKRYGVTKRRAALISKDQNNKATANLNRVRNLELGITQATWRHSGGGKTPRPTHVANNGKTYDVAKGWYDPAVKEFVWPGTQINCRCVAIPVVPGFS